jgi:uncharacterized protein YjiS (DUF1127 family)
MGPDGQFPYNSNLFTQCADDLGILKSGRKKVMKRAMSVYKGWRKKRDFIHLVLTKDSRLLKDVGYPPEIIEQRLKTPFWKFA